MRAARIHQYGDASVIRVDEVACPAPGPGQVLIRVAATSFNPSEVGLRSGLLRAALPVDLPYTLGWDVSGTVVAAGAHTGVFSPGDRVVGRLDAGGAAAEYAVADVAGLVRAPAIVPLAHAGALPVAGLTAWQAVVEHARVEPGQRVLVNGAGGGVGGFAVQLAAHAGASVVATASPRSAGAVRRLGAGRVVDYTVSPVGEVLDEPVDVILNLVPLSPAASAGLLSTLRPGGTVVSITNPVEAPASARVRAMTFVARNDVGQLRALVDLVDAGAVRIDVAASRPLADIASVHRDAEAGRTRGKIVMIP
ncbi:NADP-dependent oxidoreductase [Actinoplanes missouriensis]|uniref:NADP-dependent oxidoreductase n=1 Tax=Actinoplanes missouriensis TaxID=1866 RepID=UPI00340C38F1